MIEKMLRDKIGLSYDAIGRKNAEDSICRHMRKLGAGSLEEYHRAISSSKELLAELIHSLVVPETWFFRYGESFVFVADQAAKIISGKGLVRILSIPCSTGEEPYSIAVSLLASGIGPERIRIDAADVSMPLIEKARRGVYGQNCFRSGIPEPAKRFFTEKDKVFEVDRKAKDLVTFHNFSIFDNELLSGGVQYDIIFCRNLLIYFSAEEQEKAIRILSGILSESGILLLGHSEYGIAKRLNFEPVNFPHSFAFRKQAAVRSHNTVAKTGLPAVEIKGSHTPRLPESRLNKTADQQRNDKNEKAPSMQEMIEKAAVLADRGKLHEAEALCLQFLESDKLSPSAYYLLGVVNLSLRRTKEAAKAFSRTLYLNPDHYEALIQLALIKERSGEHEEASRMKQRAGKLTSAGHK
ncbi:MAG TPA: hypothetical protein DET40_14155 [Lentisphaeria bacterium]|nr:MAG: hypothetical protein A2X45_20850 [Lentisphaerae bacterium GWF2_50_93]HCE44681.1 hypothetical protein [Lentisphaeria bacterium]